MSTLINLGSKEVKATEGEETGQECTEDAPKGGIKEQEDEEKQSEPQRDETDPYTAELHELLDVTIVAADRLLREKTGRGLPLEKYQNFNISLKY